MTVKWRKRFLEVASCIATWSKDPTTKVGCVLVGDNREILSTGYNGLPRGVVDENARMERPAKYLWTSHAEENAVAQAARNGIQLKGSIAYVTHAPCARCARSLIQAGIREVVIGGGATSMPQEEFTVALKMFQEAKIKIIALDS